MLDDAVAAFLSSVPERAFDEPLMAALRSAGFERVRRVHGSFEFGKDVIAQRDGEQWAFQSKAGDIGLPTWRQMTGQLDELRLSRLGHPDFDAALPKRSVLVTTGRLTGGAPLSAQEYNERNHERGESILEIWDRDVLIGMLSGNPDAVLRGSIDGQLLTFLGVIDEGVVDMDTVETFSRRWASWDTARFASLGLVELAVACERLRATERLDLASHLALCGVRAAHAGAAGVVTAARDDAANSSGAIFETYASSLWESAQQVLDELTLVRMSGAAAWVTYPIRCTRLAELLALLALRLSSRGTRTVEIEQWIADFVALHPASCRLFGDRYAVSLIPVALVMARVERAKAADAIRRAAVWLCDRYERGEPGLASYDAPPLEEIGRIFGSAFDSTEFRKRRASLAAAVVLDVSALLEMADLYEDVRNDLAAVGIQPDVLLAGQGADAFMRAGISNRWQYNADYVDKMGTGPVAPHLTDPTNSLQPEDRAWDLLAASSVLRDRHFPSATRTFAELALGRQAP